MFYVYVIKSKVTGELYIGYSNDLKRRLVEYNSKLNKSTKHKAPFELVYYEAYKSQGDAKYRENNLKDFAQAYTQLKKRIEGSLL
jgi:putative endonuclease